MSTIDPLNQTVPPGVWSQGKPMGVITTDPFYEQFTGPFPIVVIREADLRVTNVGSQEFDWWLTPEAPRILKKKGWGASGILPPDAIDNLHRIERTNTTTFTRYITCNGQMNNVLGSQLGPNLEILDSIEEVSLYQNPFTFIEFAHDEGSYVGGSTTSILSFTTMTRDDITVTAPWVGPPIGNDPGGGGGGGSARPDSGLLYPRKV